MSESDRWRDAMTASLQDWYWRSRAELLPNDGAGENDHLVQRTFNGLRPDDDVLPQPPQDPGWVGS